MLSANEILHPLHELKKVTISTLNLNALNISFFSLCSYSLLSPHYQDDGFRKQAIGDPENHKFQFNFLVKIKELTLLKS